MFNKYSDHYLDECKKSGQSWNKAGSDTVYFLMEHREHSTSGHQMTPSQIGALASLRDALLIGDSAHCQGPVDKVFSEFASSSIADRKVRKLVSTICKNSGNRLKRTAEQRNPSSPLLKSRHGSQLEETHAGVEKYAAVYRDDRDREAVGVKFWQTAAMRTIQALIKNRGGFSERLHTADLKESEGWAALPVIEDGRVDREKNEMSAEQKCVLMKLMMYLECAEDGLHGPTEGDPAHSECWSEDVKKQVMTLISQAKTHFPVGLMVHESHANEKVICFLDTIEADAEQLWDSPDKTDAYHP
jgi:hypothetical protein